MRGERKGVSLFHSRPISIPPKQKVPFNTTTNTTTIYKPKLIYIYIMRSTSCCINLVLNRQRPNKNGQMPVYLRLMFKGERKNIKTGVYVPENQWDTKRQCVKSTFSGFSELNETLFEIKRKYTAIRDAFIKRGVPYTVADIASGDRARTGMSDGLYDVLESMAAHKGLSHNTAMAYRASVRRLGEAGVSCLSDVSPDSVQGLCKRLKSNGLSDSSVNVTMACLGSLWKYGVDLGLCEGYLFSRFKSWKKYRIAERKISLSESDMELLMNYFIQQSVRVDVFDAVWWYTDDAYMALMNRNSELFALACFLLCYQLQGLAFADLVRIKDGNVRIVELDKKRYYCFSGLKRKKTNKVIKDIFVEITDEVNPLFHIFYDTMGKRGGYFLPVLQNNEGMYRYDDDKKVSEATGSCSVVVNRKLRDVFERLELDVEGATFYTARHTFATHYIMNGGNPVLLAELMGRSVNGIFRYVTGLTSNEQNIRERNKVFKK